MTAKEWIIYILENELEDEPIFKDGKLLGFISVGEAAVKFDVGMATINFWISNGYLNSVRIGDHVFIPATAERPNV